MQQTTQFVSVCQSDRIEAATDSFTISFVHKVTSKFRRKLFDNRLMTIKVLFIFNIKQIVTHLALNLKRHILLIHKLLNTIVLFDNFKQGESIALHHDHKLLKDKGNTNRRQHQQEQDEYLLDVILANNIAICNGRN